MNDKSASPMVSRWRIWRIPLLTLVIFLVLSLYFITKEMNPLQANMGERIQNVFHSTIDGHLARNDLSKPQIRHWQDALPKTGEGSVLWVGNSHLHAINNYVKGQNLSSVHLHDMLNGPVWPGKVPVFGISFPNLSAQEAFLVTLYLCLRKDLPRPLTVVSGYRYFDTRENMIRESLRPLLKEAKMNAWLSKRDAILATEYPVFWQRLKSEGMGSEEAGVVSGEEGKVGQKAGFLETIGRRIPIYGQRVRLEMNLRFTLRGLRNKILGIKSTSKRPMLPGRYTEAIEAMSLAAHACRQEDVSLLLYNVPFRPSVENPYPKKEYGAFIEDMRRVGQAFGDKVKFRDYGDLIPEDDWGYYYDGQPDFSHFKETGMVLLAKQVKDDLSEMGMLP